MKIVIETHKYAPELNKVIVRGVAIPAPGITTIREARRYLFAPAIPSKRLHIRVRHTEHQACDRDHIGRIGHTHSAIEWLAHFRKRHNLPDAKVTVQSIKLMS
jgi:hypothetical protein